ncbi:MAG: YeeE/YedE thiosulfate transporter family protein [Planctomycetota bacterium]
MAMSPAEDEQMDDTQDRAHERQAQDRYRQSAESTVGRQPDAWWPWAPAAIALAGVILFIFATHGPPASSSGFVSFLSGLFGSVSEDYVHEHEHYAMLPGVGSWLFAFVVGMAGGGFIAGRTGRRQVVDVPPIWRERFGPSRGRRYAATFIGGFLILFAARLTGGCTLGLFMSGTIQLAISGILFGTLIFASAMATAFAVYGRQAGRS